MVLSIAAGVHARVSRERGRHAPFGQTAIAERPIHEQLEIFCVEQVEQGLISHEEYMQLERLVTVAEAAGATPDVLVVLEAPLEHLIDRIQARARPGEERYSSEYLHRLHERYALWAASWTRSPLVRVDAVARDVRSLTDVRQIAADVKTALEK